MKALKTKRSLHCIAGGHDTCPGCDCSCHGVRAEETVKSWEQVMEQPEVLGTGYLPVQVGPEYTDAHWAIEKAIEVGNAALVLPNAKEILAFIRENREPEQKFPETPEAPTTKRGSWK